MSDGRPSEEFGPYLVYEQLGVGGMAQVHRAVARSSDLQQPVALKRMLSHIASNEEMVNSFVREARLASYLRHQNVPQTYDLGRVDDVYFIVMELITGRNLREVLKHCARTTGPMPVQVALNILNQICDALDYAHNLRDDTGKPLGIIHRDVSPSNVIVSETGVVKLIDFGIAKVAGAGMQTKSGTLKGKFAYMAPEYFAGQLDARADLFAIGVIAHELLTNRPLFSGRDDVDTATRVRSMPIAPPSAKNPLVPPEIDEVVMTALARDPARRWQHATALRTALTTLTQRLDLVATNTQVVRWLDWAFAHTVEGPPPTDRPESDTEIDSPPGSEDPSIMIEGGAAALVPPSKRPDSTVLGTAAPLVRAGRITSPPAIHPNAPPMSAALLAHMNAVQALAAPGGHGNAAPVQPTPGPAVPASAPHVFPAAPGLPPGGMTPFAAPHPQAPPPSYDPARPAVMPQAWVPSPAAVAPRRSSRWLTVGLVVLAAAIAVITVYIVLPLLTGR